MSVDYVFREPRSITSIHASRTTIRFTMRWAMPRPRWSICGSWNGPPKNRTSKGWTAALDAVSETEPGSAAGAAGARRDQVADRRENHDRPDRQPKVLSYGDILILVRRRGKAFDAIIQALKHAGIPVAGADRLKLTEHIAVIDLMDLADALLLPRDDLALAVALKSPLFGLDDDDLLVLAPKRKGTLRRALAEHAATIDKFKAALDAPGKLRRDVFQRHAFHILCLAAWR